MKTSTPRNVVSLVTFFLVAGCAFEKPACMVIDIAKAACAIITIPAADGGTEEVRVSRDELLQGVSAIKASRAAGYKSAYDGGAP